MVAEKHALTGHHTVARRDLIAAAIRGSGRPSVRGLSLAPAPARTPTATTESSSYGRADLAGRYSITGLSTGTYQVTFYPCRSRTRMLASSTRPAAVLVTAPQAVTGINGKLGVAGSISGTVRATADGALQTGACVIAVPADPNGSYGYALSGKRGAYQVRGLGAGTYHVYFGDPFCPYFGAGPTTLRSGTRDSKPWQPRRT